MCTFMYLFVEYFSFSPVISANIHRYVNYSDIQVPMIVSETYVCAVINQRWNAFKLLFFSEPNANIFFTRPKINKFKTISQMWG